MFKPQCTVCGAEDWPEKLYFCPTDGVWVCPRCCVWWNLMEVTPRCPRCHHPLRQDPVSAAYEEKK